MMNAIYHITIYTAGQNCEKNEETEGDEEFLNN